MVLYLGRVVNWWRDTIYTDRHLAEALIAAVPNADPGAALPRAAAPDRRLAEPLDSRAALPSSSPRSWMTLKRAVPAQLVAIGPPTGW